MGHPGAWPKCLNRRQKPRLAWRDWKDGWRLRRRHWPRVPLNMRVPAASSLS